MVLMKGMRGEMGNAVLAEFSAGDAGVTGLEIKRDQFLICGQAVSTECGEELQAGMNGWSVKPEASQSKPGIPRSLHQPGNRIFRYLHKSRCILEIRFDVDHLHFVDTPHC